ncbi:hypothetical protein ACFWWC_21565 [Streptomyces sp. NPDC058642]
MCLPEELQGRVRAAAPSSASQLERRVAVPARAGEMAAPQEAYA